MHSFTIAALSALAATIVNAAPAALSVPEVKLEARTYPTVATYEAQMTEVDPAYLESLKTVVINLDENVNESRDLETRQSGTCDIQGFAIVSGSLTPFQGAVQNSAANYGRAVTLTGVLPGCSIGLIPQANCAQWSVIDTSGCATSRSVTFTN